MASVNWSRVEAGARGAKWNNCLSDKLLPFSYYSQHYTTQFTPGNCKWTALVTFLFGALRGLIAGDIIERHEAGGTLKSINRCVVMNNVWPNFVPLEMFLLLARLTNCMCRDASIWPDRQYLDSLSLIGKAQINSHDFRPQQTDHDRGVTHTAPSDHW